jgi:hypothetical protein
MKPSIHRLSIFGVLLALLLAAAAPAVAESSDPTVLGRDGAVWRLLSGSYGELFPEGAEADPRRAALALEVSRAGDEAERWLVPGSVGRDVDAVRNLVLEERTQLVYVLWEGLLNGVHPMLYLTSFDGSAFSEVIEISGSPFSSKGSPQLVVTRESSPLAGSDKAGNAGERTILHLVWWEELAGTSRKLYSPIILEQGMYLGDAPVFDLGGLVPEGGDKGWEPVTGGIGNALVARPGKDSRTLVVGFLDPESHHLVTLRLRVLPRELGELAEGAAAAAIELGAEAASREELADQLHAAVLELGAAFHEASRLYMADRAELLVASAEEESTPDGLSILAEKLRAEVIIIGIRIGANGLDSPDDTQVVSIGPEGEAGNHGHLLGVSVVGDRPAPEVDGPASLFLSESGYHALVVWEGEGDRLYYRESTPEGWTEAAFLQLGPELDRETAYGILADRIGER